MPRHRLVNIHRGKRRNIEAGEPHIYHDGNFHRVSIIFELLGQFFLILLIANDIMPFFRVVVGSGHHNLYFLSPVGTEFQDALVNTDSNRTGERNYHGLSGQFKLSVFLIVFEDILNKRVNGLRRTEDLF